jgi:hypothetical protein
MASKKKAVPNDTDPCSILAKALAVQNRFNNDVQTAGQIDAADALLERAVTLVKEYGAENLAEHMPQEYVDAAGAFLRASVSDQRAMSWVLRVRAAKMLLKYGIMLKDEQ